MDEGMLFMTEKFETDKERERVKGRVSGKRGQNVNLNRWLSPGQSHLKRGPFGL